MGGSMEFQRVNVDNKDDPVYQQYAGKFRGIPTILWTDESGQIVRSTNGFANEQAFVDEIEKFQNQQ
jgi:hypothetical protein